MTSTGWSLVMAVARLLEREEREAVLGDLAESGASAGQALVDILGLIIRRQATPWKNWRPWLAAFGLVLPGSFLLLGASVSVSWTFQRLGGLQILTVTPLSPPGGFLLWLGQVLLLIALSWTGGFVAASVSRSTLRVSAVLCALPCFFCLARFQIESLPRFCLLLFLLPAILGASHGLRTLRVKMDSAIAIAVATTVLMAILSESGRSVAMWALLWPTWYMVATAQRPSQPSLAKSSKDRENTLI